MSPETRIEPTMAQIDHQREIVRALLRDPTLPAASMRAQLAARGVSVEEATVEQLRKIVDLVLEEQSRPAETKPLRARPVEGEIDHEALSREFMARYPKIRAALAK
jgi:hypothetical protein